MNSELSSKSIRNEHINNRDRMSIECTNMTVEGHLAEGKLQHLESALNQLKSLKFRFGTRRPTFSKRVGQYLNHC